MKEPPVKETEVHVTLSSKIFDAIATPHSSVARSKTSKKLSNVNTDIYKSDSKQALPKMKVVKKKKSKFYGTKSIKNKNSPSANKYLRYLEGSNNVSFDSDQIELDDFDESKHLDTGLTRDTKDFTLARNRSAVVKQTSPRRPATKKVKKQVVANIVLPGKVSPRSRSRSPSPKQLS